MVSAILILLGIFLLPVMISNGDWGPALSALVIGGLIAMFCSAWKKDDDAYSNFIDYWADKDRTKEKKER